MRAVIQVLAAEIPDVQSGRFWVACIKQGRGHQDAVSGWLGVVVIFAAQAPADLRLADTAVAEDDQFHVSGCVLAGFQIAVSAVIPICALAPADRSACIPNN